MHADLATLLVDEPTTAKKTKKTTRATSQDQSSVPLSEGAGDRPFDIAAIHQQFGSEIAAVFSADTAPQSAAGTGDRTDPSPWPSSGYQRPAGPLPKSSARSKQSTGPMPKSSAAPMSSSGSKQPANRTPKPSSGPSSPLTEAQQAEAPPWALTVAALAANLQTFTERGLYLYLERLDREAGSPADPLAQMLLRQATVAHLVSMSLLSQAAHVEGVKMQELMQQSAARLMGEFRKTALAFKAYQAGGAGSPAAARPEPSVSAADDQNDTGADENEPNSSAAAEPETSGGWKTQSAQDRPLDGGGPAAAA